MPFGAFCQLTVIRGQLAPTQPPPPPPGHLTLTGPSSLFSSFFFPLLLGSLLTGYSLRCPQEFRLSLLATLNV